MTITIRPATSVDRSPILALAPRLREGVASWRDVASVTAAVTEWINSSVDHREDVDRALFVAEFDGAVVGFVSVSEQHHWAGDVDAYIGELVVTREVEGRGVGSSLVDAAIAWARSQGYRRISVATGAANAPARRLYSSLGFEDEDVTLTAAL